MQQRMDTMEILKDRFANLANPLPAQFAPSRLAQSVTSSFKKEEIKPVDSLAFAPLSKKLESPDSKELLRQALAFNESLAKAEQRWLGQLKIISQLPTGSPVAKNAGMSSDYGTRIDPFTHSLAYHPGIDFSVGHGSPIMATGDGVISKIDVDRNNGQYLEIEHASGFTTRYAHVSSFSVRTGDPVKRGQVIAAVGNTGRSTGPHLHYEIRYQGVSINPLQALTQASQQVASANPTQSR
jgi:murein DD-endopeptidase MepM/ murein hydrolase activator NlpD